MRIIKRKNRTRILRKARTRARTRGSATRPRLSVFRSNTNLYAQLIDDLAGKTIVTGSLKDITSATKTEGMNARVAKAFALGKFVAEKAKQAGITAIVFDRGGYAYHGRVKALADGAREGGLKF